ncbi:MAG: hypothetical protein U0835_06655 [Isosphaeraceae bacterium]
METRDLMAPDTDPTDEELEAATRTAAEIVRARKAISDAWVAAKIEEATRQVRERRERREAEGGSR